MRALSIRQPWAWLILNAGKDIENRDWQVQYRGRILIHAGLTMTRADHADALHFAEHHANVDMDLLRDMVGFDQLRRGGIVGSVEIADCVSTSRSPWFVGEFGFVLRNPEPLPFLPWKGKLGFFDVPIHALQTSAQEPQP